MLTTETLYLSKASEFNDPWDSKPHFYLPREDQYEERAELVEHLVGAFKRRGKSFSEEQIEFQRQRLLKDYNLFRKIILDTTAGNQKYIENDHGLYCLSAKSSCELMWAHYASKHHGIRLRFSTKEKPFSLAYRIAYRKKYPKLLLTRGGGAILETLLTKSKAWSYENEYRLITWEKGGQTDLTEEEKSILLLSDSRRLRFNPSSLDEIVLGCQMTIENVLIFESVIKKLAPHIIIRRAMQHPTEYKLIYI